MKRKTKTEAEKEYIRAKGRAKKAIRELDKQIAALKRVRDLLPRILNS